MRSAVERLALTVVVALICAHSAQTSAQDRMEYPQQIRRQPIQANPSGMAATTNAVAQAGYQVPAENHQLNVNKNGFPSLTPAAQSTTEQPQSKSSSLGPLVTTGFSLVVVLGLFAGLVWVTRRYGNGSMTQSRVPSDVLKSLGSTAIDARTQVTMLRCGNRIIVIAQTASGVHPLSEITDPAEVNRLTIACTGDGQAPVPTFAETLKQTDAGSTGGRLFASA